MQVLARVGGIMPSVKDASLSEWIFVKVPVLLLSYWNCFQGAEHLGYRAIYSSVTADE